MITCDLDQGKCTFIAANASGVGRYIGTVPTGGTFDSSTNICFGGDCNTQRVKIYGFRDIEIEYNNYYERLDDRNLGALFAGIEDRNRLSSI